MNSTQKAAQFLLAAIVAFAFVPTGSALAEEAKSAKQFQPYSGQPGRDTPWVPTPDVTVQTMLDFAKLTPKDYVIDLGSGDGRMVIAAAKRGAHGHGVEFNPDMVVHSNRLAKEAGVADRAHFVQGDMFAADISKATVLPLFLLTENLNQLAPNFMKLRPGTRIVVNYFRISGWEHDAATTAKGDCGSWCEIYMYVVPARVEGAWQLGKAKLNIDQEYQKFTGTLDGVAIEDGRLLGDEITFTVGKTRYTGRVNGGEMRGETKGERNGSWTAKRS